MLAEKFDYFIAELKDSEDYIGVCFAYLFRAISWLFNECRRPDKGRPHEKV